MRLSCVDRPERRPTYPTIFRDKNRPDTRATCKGSSGDGECPSNRTASEDCSSEKDWPGI